MAAVEPVVGELQVQAYHSVRSDGRGVRPVGRVNDEGEGRLLEGDPPVFVMVLADEQHEKGRGVVNVPGVGVAGG